MRTAALAPSGVMLRRNRHASGDEEGLTAPEQVQALAGEDAWKNPWRLAWSSTHIDGPTALRVDFGDPFDFSDSERMLLVWDTDGVLPVVVTQATVAEGSSQVFEVPSVAGDRLELWVTDDVPVTVTALPLGRANEERRNIAAKKKTSFDPFGDVLDAVSRMQALVVVGVVVVAVVAGPSIVKAFRGG